MSGAVRWLLCAVVWLLAAYFSYAVAAGYIGGGALPSPLNLLAGLALLGVGAAGTMRLLQPRASLSE